MDTSKLFKVNSADIQHESFNDEVVIINLKSGIYYSLNNPGRIIWQLILNNFSPEQVIRIFLAVFPEQNTGYEENIEQFFLELESEGRFLPAHRLPAHARRPPIVGRGKMVGLVHGGVKAKGRHGVQVDHVPDRQHEWRVHGRLIPLPESRWHRPAMRRPTRPGSRASWTFPIPSARASRDAP